MEKFKVSRRTNPVFYQAFRSITLMLKPNRNNGQLSIPLNIILNWLTKYDTWWTKGTGISKGRNLHLLYGRYVTCIGSGLLSLVPELLEIATLSSNMGCIFSLEVDLSDVTDKMKLFNKLVQSGQVGLLSIKVDANAMNNKSHITDYVSIIENIIKKGISLNLLGSLDFWRELGILNSSTLNSSSYRIIPSNDDAVKNSNLLNLNPIINSKMSKRNGGDNYLLNSFNPCSERFQIYITSSGDLYPCEGLIGMSSCKMGTIYENIENTVFAGKDSFLDFNQLAMNGPKLQMKEITSHNSSNCQNLPQICALHREYILENH